MFGRLIKKISSFNKATILSSFNQIENTNNQKIRFPLVCDTFKELSSSRNIFADKTLLIKNLLDFNCKAYLFTRPRRWGKSLNLNMIETFFQADVNKNTGEFDFESQSKKILFQDLKISQTKLKKNPITDKLTEEDTLNFQGKFPVIKMTFYFICPPDKNSMVEEFANMLRPVFLEHDYLLNSNKSLKTPELELIDLYINHIHEGISLIEVEKSLQYLIDAIYAHYGRKVILLIDEYDKTITDLRASQSPLLNDAIKLFNSILEPVKNNDKLLFTVFVGATKLAKAEIFTGFKGFYHDSVLHSEFSEFFGLTEDEVDGMIKKLIIIKPELEKVKESVTNWYNGYKIGNKIIYNPWSIMYCLDALYNNMNRPYSDYWINTGSTEFVEKALMKIPTIDKIEKLIMYGKTEFVYNESFTFESIKANEEDLLSLLLNSGYITLDKKNIYKIPNNEVQLCFNRIMPLFLENHYKKNGHSLASSFENGEAYCRVFQQEILKNGYYNNFNEAYFQSLILFPFDNQNNFQVKHEVYMEKRTNDNKRTNILLIPIDENSTSVFFLEIKKTERHGSIKKMMKEAFLQVFSKGYVGYVINDKCYETFHIRAIVFSPDKLKKNWMITIKEFKLNKEGLHIVCKSVKKSKNKKKEIIEFLTLHSISSSEYHGKT